MSKILFLHAWSSEHNMKNKKTGVTMCIINGKGQMIHERSYNVHNKWKRKDDSWRENRLDFELLLIDINVWNVF